MRKPVLTIFYQFNPLNPSIGGIQTLICSFIKHAPSDFELRVVGTSTDSAIATGKWHEAEVEGKEILFMPLFYLENDNVRSVVPTTLRYTLKLVGQSLASDFMHFHRLEPSLATLSWPGDKTLFVHNDIRQQMTSKDNKNAILWRRFPAAYFALERLLFGQFKQILSCNSNAIDLYRQRYPDIAERVGYFTNTVDNEIFYPWSREEKNHRRVLLAKQLDLAEDTRFILFAGRLHPQKDPLLLVRSIAALNQPNVHLLIAGDGELAQEVRAEIAWLGLSKQITMLGAKSQAEIADLHRTSSICILTSAYEGLPLVVLEALACGIPVVTTPCGDTPKLLSPNSGVVCQERTPACIADALRKVLLHPEDYSMESCVRIAQPYAARTVIRKVYNDMLQRWEMGGLVAVNS